MVTRLESVWMHELDDSREYEECRDSMVSGLRVSGAES